MPAPASVKIHAAVAINVVAKLPHLEKIAEIPTSRVAAVLMIPIKKATLMALLTLTYVFSPVRKSDGREDSILCNPQISIGSNAKIVCGVEQFAY